MIRFTHRNTPERVSLRDGVRELHPDPFQAVLQRLADYEDTGLTPQEVAGLIKTKNQEEKTNVRNSDQKNQEAL